MSKLYDLDTEKIYLGQVSDFEEIPVTIRGEKLHIDKHKWDCGWYYGMGYIGNKNLHCHFDDNLLGGNHDVHKLFVESKYTQSQWWQIRDYMIQAYALRKCAEVYRYGGYQTGGCDDIKDDEMCTRLNADLKIILDKVWSIFCDQTQRAEELKAIAQKEKDDTKAKIKKLEDEAKKLKAELKNS